MDEDHEFSDAELEDSGSAGRSSDDGSCSGSDPVSSDKSSEDSNDELSGSAMLGPYCFEPQLYLTTAMAMMLEMRGCLICHGKL